MTELIANHFTVDEFACKDGTEYPDEWIQARLQPLCTLLDIVRQEHGGPIVVVSGYRTPAYNRRIGGAAKSRHVEGDGVDIAPLRPSPERCERLHHLILRLHHARRVTGLGGIGLYKHWVHVDIRPRAPGQDLARWTGSGVGTEVA